MKSQVNLLLALLREQGDYCATRTDQDVKYILDRWSNEGDSFLTITLPSFDKGLLQALAEEVAVPSHWPSFSHRGSLPEFLSGFSRNVFRPDGSVRPTTPRVVNNIRAMRQIVLFMSKLFLVCSEGRVDKAMKQYVETDAEVPLTLPEETLAAFEATALDIFGEYLQDVENTLYRDGISPSHGPGAVANRLGNNARWSCNTWTDRLERPFPAYSVLCTGPKDWSDSAIRYLSEEQEPPVRVIPVPKTMKTPRIIAVEPSWQMYAQQGILNLMTDALYRHPSVNEYIGWTDQEPNRNLCRDWEHYATIDLSEASDRVPLVLVDRLLARFPLLRESVMAARTTKALLPDGTSVLLRKFASMGSALCFPFESIVFATVASLGGQGTPVSIHPRTFHKWRARVYGDDIIVPIDSVASVIRTLEQFKFKVNTNKSFWTGKFRESCGADWYDGHDVSVVKIRQLLPDVRQHGFAVLKAIDLHNRLFEAGLFKPAEYIEEQLCKLGFGYYAPLGNAGFAMWTYDSTKVVLRVHPDNHDFQVKTVVPRIIPPVDNLDGWGALRKHFFANLGEERLMKGWSQRKLRSIDHLERAGRSQRVAINVGWSRLTER